jgi:hypothetical protein
VGARSRQCFEAVQHGVLAGTPVAGADRGLTLMWRWAIPTVAGRQ